MHYNSCFRRHSTTIKHSNISGKRRTANQGPPEDKQPPCTGQCTVDLTAKHSSKGSLTCVWTCDTCSGNKMTTQNSVIRIQALASIKFDKERYLLSPVLLDSKYIVLYRGEFVVLCPCGWVVAHLAGFWGSDCSHSFTIFLSLCIKCFIYDFSRKIVFILLLQLPMCNPTC